MTVRSTAGQRTVGGLPVPPKWRVFAKALDFLRRLVKPRRTSIGVAGSMR